MKTHIGEEKVSERPYERLPVPKEATREMERELGLGYVVIGQEEEVLS